jgi:hypothetical protein
MEAIQHKNTKAGDVVKYINGKDIFPSELLELVQKYAQGEYVYIPQKGEKEKWGTNTTYRKELDKRNSHIYTRFLSGFTVSQLKARYSLSEKSIRRILFSGKKVAEKMIKVIKEILVQWNINEEVKQVYDSVWSVGKDYIIKKFGSPEIAERNIIMKRG